MELPFNRENYKWNLNGLMACMHDNSLESEIIYSTPTCAVVYVKNYHDSQILGSESDWCICQHSCSWEQYVESEDRVQLFFFNFKRICKPHELLVGATFEINDNEVSLYCCFGRDNKPISSYYNMENDLYALNEFILKKFFGFEFIGDGNDPVSIAIIRIFKERESKGDSVTILPHDYITTTFDFEASPIYETLSSIFNNCDL